jgi:hypothetical protein
VTGPTMRDMDSFVNPNCWSIVIFLFYSLVSLDFSSLMMSHSPMIMAM